MPTKTKTKTRTRSKAHIKAPQRSVPDIIHNTPQRTWMDANAGNPAPIAGVGELGGGMLNIIPAMYQAWGAYGYQPAITWYQLANMYVSWEYTATEKIARTLAGLPAKLYRYENMQGKTIKPYFAKSLMINDITTHKSYAEIVYKLKKYHGLQKIEIDDHPFIDLVNHPNGDMVRYNFWRMLCIHLELNGAVGIYKAKPDGFGNPTELHILPATWTGQFKPVPGTDGVNLIRAYRLLDQNINTEFSREEIIWIHYTSLRNPFEGMSALKAQLYSFNMDQYLMQQISAFYKNGAMFSNVFSTDQVLVQKQYDAIAAQLQSYQGAKNAGQKFILHSGLKMEKPLSATARDSMVDEIERMARDKMLSAHDLSAGKIGLTEHQNRANLETVDMGFFNEAIKPRAMLITEYFNEHMIKHYDENLDFEFDYPHFQDRELDLKERQVNINSGLTTRNEEREKIGMEPVDGGDVILISPMNAPLSSLANPQEKPAVLPGASGGKLPINPAEKGGPGSGRHPEDGVHLTSNDKSVLTDWVYANMNPGARDYEAMRDPETKEGKEFTDTINKMPLYNGVLYRGVSLDAKEMKKLTSVKSMELKLHSSSSKDKNTAIDFMKQEGENNPKASMVIMEVRGSGRDISIAKESEFGGRNLKEVVLTSGTRYNFQGVVREEGYTHMILQEVKK